MIKSVVTGQAPVTLSGAEEYPRGKTQTNRRWYSHISQLTQFMPPPETCRSEIGRQPTLSQVHTGAHVSLLAPGKTDYTACHQRKSTTYILHVVPITTHTHDRRKSIGKKKQRKEKKIKERKEKTRERKNEKEKKRKHKTRKARKYETRKGARKGKEKENVILADPRNWLETALGSFFFFSHFYLPASGRAVVTGVVPSPPRFLPTMFIAHRVQQSPFSSIFHRVLLLTHALALSASQFVHKKKSQRIYTCMHSAGLELTKLTYTRLEDNLIRHRGDRPVAHCCCLLFSH